MPASGRPELSQWNSKQLRELVSKVERDAENVKKDLGQIEEVGLETYLQLQELLEDKKATDHVYTSIS